MEENKIIATSLINESKKIIDEVELKEKETGESFNIFQTLNLATDEVRISSLIAEFLNPLGTHKQGNKYLNIFLENLYEKNPNFVNEKFTKKEILKDARVFTEQFHIVENIGSRIDIIIENDKYAIVIENKIEAGDQDNQLWRYYQSKKDKKVMIIYLTKNGDFPSEKSNTLKSKNNDSSIVESQITCLSYHFDILQWLSNCNDKNNPKNISVIMEHLVQNIRKITNQVDKNMENSLIELLLKDDNFKIANEISKVIPIVIAEKTYDFFMAIKNELDKNNFGFECYPYQLESEPKFLWNWNEDKTKIIDNIVLQHSQVTGVVRLFFYQKNSGHLISIADGSYVGNSFVIGVKNIIDKKLSYTDSKITEILSKDKTKIFPYREIQNISCWNNGIFNLLEPELFKNSVNQIVTFVLNIMNILK